jgi:hypothetical protein
MAEEATIVGGIAKLTIEAFTDPACTKEAGEDPIVVLINPESYSQSFGMLYTDDEAAGSRGEKVVEREKVECLTLALVFDGTGVVPGLPRKSVAGQIRDLRRVGLTLVRRKANFLLLSWGTLRFKCRMKSLKVNYTLFNPDGTPLRAKVDATFEGVHGAEEAAKKEREAEDKGKYIMYESGSLAAMCAGVYGDSGYMLDVASANQLDSFRKLTPGEILYFPPIEEIAG